MCEPATFASVLRKSNELAELEAVAQSWFEDDPQVAQAVERARGRPKCSLTPELAQASSLPREGLSGQIFGVSERPGWKPSQVGTVSFELYLAGLPPTHMRSRYECRLGGLRRVEPIPTTALLHRGGLPTTIHLSHRFQIGFGEESCSQMVLSATEQMMRRSA